MSQADVPDASEPLIPDSQPGVMDEKHNEPVSQNELKKQAINHLRALHEETMTEAHAKAIFDRYDTDGRGLWNMSNLRVFLFDLQESFEDPRVVPDEALQDVIKELQLNSESAGVTWVEFKSYMIYLQKEPLKVLHERISSFLPVGVLIHAVVVSSLPASITKEHLLARFVQACGLVTRVYIVHDGKLTEALVCFDGSDAAAKALTLDGSQLLESTIAVRQFTGQDFPGLTYQRKLSKFVKGVAKVVVRAQEFDEEHKISQSVNQAANKVTTSINEFVTKHKLAERAQDTTKKVDTKLKISETASKMDEKYKLSEKVDAAKAKVDELLQHEKVQQAKGFLAGLAKTVQQSVEELSNDTKAAIKAERAKRGHPTAEFEME